MKNFFSISILFLFLASCSSSIEEPDTTDSYDREKMLINLADNIIIPAHEDFSSKMDVLKSAGEDFESTPDQANLETLRTSWTNAYMSWQNIEMYAIGKAEEIQYRNFMNVYPVTVSDVEDNIAEGNYDLDHVNNHDAQGFPALDYLLFGVASDDAEILAKYTTDGNASNYRKYILDIVNQMSAKTTVVVNDWKGAYRDDFVASISNTSTSAVNKLVNDFIFYYEKGLRANKFGIPAGVFSSTPLPEKVEGYYKNTLSKDLALQALTAVEDFFAGKHFNSAAKGQSFSDYLISLDRNDISENIQDQFGSAKNQIQNLSDSFSEQVNTDNTKMTRAYDELQKAVVFLKVDMLQAFNINVDYVDADGD